MQIICFLILLMVIGERCSHSHSGLNIDVYVTCRIHNKFLTWVHLNVEEMLKKCSDLNPNHNVFLHLTKYFAKP